MISMIEQLSDSFSRYQEYEILMCGNQRFHEALTNIYYNILIFLKKAKQVFTTRDSLNPRHFSLHRVKGHCAGVQDSRLYAKTSGAVSKQISKMRWRH